MTVINFILENYQTFITAVVTIISGVISICLLIPGEQPEKFLQGVVNFIGKFSRKSDPK